MYASRSWCAVSLVVMLIACRETSAPRVPARRQPAALVRLAGDTQVGVVGEIVRVAPSVRVVDTAGLPVPAASVVFAVVSGGGSIRGAVVLSDTAGIATLGGWRLGTVAGANALTATVANVPLLLFTATGKAGAPFAIRALTSAAQTALGGRSVPIAPAVEVRDTFGNVVAGVSVAFTITAGGGSVSAPSVLTDVNGVASTAWTLGPVFGTHSLTAMVGRLPGVTFNASVASGSPATVEKLAGDSQSAAAGYPVSVPPSVLVQDSSGNPAFAQVTFSVASGGGTITGASAFTDSRGVASVGSWTLGSASGPNSLTAVVSGLPGVTFTATASARPSSPPATIAKLAGDSQTTRPGSAVGIRPSVVVRDSAGNPAIMLVTFRVASGGGTVSGASVLTDSLGVATVGSWTLGPLNGENTLAASVPGLPAVTFTAVGLDNCPAPLPYVIGTTVTGQLTSTDCRHSPSTSPVDRYDISVTGTVSAELQLASSAFQADFGLFSQSGNVAYAQGCDCETTSTRVVLAPGHYQLEVTGYTDYGPVSGDYTLTSALASHAGCQGMVFAVPGIVTSQQIDSTDCYTTFRSQVYYGDRYTILLDSGVTYTISMSSSSFDAYLELYGPWPSVISNDDVPGTTDARIVFTATASDFYVISAETYLPGQTGAYTLSIQSTAPAPTRGRLLAIPMVPGRSRGARVHPFMIMARPPKPTAR